MQEVFQKLELINDVPIEFLDDPYQRQFYKEQLRREIASFKKRELLYIQKRRELNQLELQYRQNQNQHVAVRDQNKISDELFQHSFNQLKLQVKETKSNLAIQQTANNDLANKTFELREALKQRIQDYRELKQLVDGKQNTNEEMQLNLESQLNQLVVLKADLTDRQRELQAAKSDRTAVDSQVQVLEDEIKLAHVSRLKIQQRCNEIQREFEKKNEELLYKGDEVDKAELKLEKINIIIDKLRQDEQLLQQDGRLQQKEKESVRQKLNQVKREIDEQEALIKDKFEHDCSGQNRLIDKIQLAIYKKQNVNYQLNERNLKLLGQVEQTERHIRLTIEKNKIICKEIDQFISADRIVSKCIKERQDSTKKLLDAEEQQEQIAQNGNKTRHVFESNYTIRKLGEQQYESKNSFEQRLESKQSLYRQTTSNNSPLRPKNVH